MVRVQAWHRCHFLARLDVVKADLTNKGRGCAAEWIGRQSVKHRALFYLALGIVCFSMRYPGHDFFISGVFGENQIADARRGELSTASTHNLRWSRASGVAFAAELVPLHLDALVAFDTLSVEAQGVRHVGIHARCFCWFLKKQTTPLFHFLK